MLDELFLTLLAAAALFLFLSGPVVGWVAFLRLRRLEEELAGLRARLGEPPGRGAAEIRSAEPLRAAATARGSVPAVGPSPAPETSAGHGEPEASGARSDVEGRLAERWLVRLGGLALVLGGLFLAGWAVEQGLLGPRARLGLAFLAALVLLALAEQAWRRRPAEAEAVFLVPAALAAGGVATLYGATLAAHLLFELVPAAVALALLALAAALAVALALRYGALLAALGAFGAFAAPALVAAADPAPWALALYLAVVVTSLAGAAALRSWAWLAWLDLLGFLGWATLLFFGDRLVPAPNAGAFLLLAGAASALGLLLGSGRGAAGLARPGGALLLGTAILQLLLLVASDHAPGPVAGLALTALGAVGVALVVGAQRWVVALLAGVTLLGAASVQIPWAEATQTPLRDPSIALEPAFWIAPEARGVAAATALVGAFWALLGFRLLSRVPHPGFWAALSGFAPLAALALAHLRLGGFATSPSFAAVALGLGLLATLAARRVAVRPELVTALAAYAVAAAGAVGLALALALEEAWLTVALALEIAAIAWVARRLALPALRLPAAVLLLVVLARTLLGVELASVGGDWPVLLYGHGLPLLALVAAARLFRPVPAPPVPGLEAVLHTVATLLWLLLLTRLLATIAGAEGPADLLRLPTLAASTLGWLLTAVVLWRLAASEASPILRWLGHLVAGLGAVQLAALLLPVNPLVTGEPVGPWPIANLLAPAYLAPALGAVWVAVRAGRGPGLPPAVLRRPAGIAAVGLGLLWLTLEVRRAFQGSVLVGPTSDAEWLAWSAAWLACAGFLLALGVRLGSRPLRAAALGVGALAILKAFLFDLGELEGLYRAASFLALGLCLVGVGFLYRRYVAPPGAAA